MIDFVFVLLFLYVLLIVLMCGFGFEVFCDVFLTTDATRFS